MNPNNGLSEEETVEGNQFLAEYIELKKKFGDRWGIVVQHQLVVGRLDTPEVIEEKDEESI